MRVYDDFSMFCSNLRMTNETIKKIRNRYSQITKRINNDYRNINSANSYSRYVGSYGRGTEIWTSDIDIIVILPYETYVRFNNYKGNGQSALLQEVKQSLQKTYSNSHSKSDGQVIGINFNDNISFEIVPVFLNKNGSYTYPDTHNDGTWKVTDPKPEISTINNFNKITNGNLKRLCRMTRAWKSHCNVPMNGILIDTLAYDFMKNWKYKKESYLYYDFMSRDFFNYLSNISPSQRYSFAPGSTKKVYIDDLFQAKARKAFNHAKNAIEYANNNKFYSSNQKWREIYGTKFPI